MISVRLWLAVLVAGLMSSASGRAADRLPVVTSFSLLADIARQVGGEHVEVATLIGPDRDAHGFEPTASDAKILGAAQVFVVNGLDYEGWAPRLQRSSGFRGTLVIAARGVVTRTGETPGHSHGKSAPDPHAWQSLVNGRLYAANIRDGLIAADPERRAGYEANAARYLQAIDAAEAEVRAALARIPGDRRKVVTNHDAFAYFGAAYGLRFLAPKGVSSEGEASAQDVARIIRLVRAEKVRAVFVENVADKRLLEQIGRETGARLGGRLVSDALTSPDGPAPTYLDMFRHNARTLAAALAE